MADRARSPKRNRWASKDDIPSGHALPAVVFGSGLAYHVIGCSFVVERGPERGLRMPGKDFNVVCPCCDTKILVDHKTGSVLSHELPPKGPAKSFEEAFADDKRRRIEAEDRFSQAVREHENRDELLEKKFKEALEKAEKDDSTPPPHPFDYD